MLKLIACNVFLREACYCVALSPHVIDVEFTELGEHAHSDTLRSLIQSRIDAAEASGKPYEAILVLFGLCGNATVGLQAGRIPLVLPRAHDCCTILLGSRIKFQEHFGDAPSTPFGSAGYMERGRYFLRTEDGQAKVVIGSDFAEYVKKFGEEEARYIWEAMHPEQPDQSPGKAVFINVPETTRPDHIAEFEAKVKEQGKEYVRLEGSIRLIRDLIFGRWDPKEFLIVAPGQKTAGVYDWDQIIKSQ